MHRWWNDRIPRQIGIDTLCMATGRRHDVRLDRGSPLAVPFVILVVLLCPLLLLAVSAFWVLDKVEAGMRAAARNRSDRR